MTTNEKALLLHEEWNGKIETVSKSPIKTREALALAYTPGVAQPCKVIAEDKEAAYRYTIKANTVAVVSDGSAVLGLGNIGPYAKQLFLKSLAVSTPSQSASTHRIQKKLYAQSQRLRLPSAALIWKISLRRAVLRLKSA